MNKLLMTTCVTVAGIIGSYIPILLWHAGGLSGWSILGGLFGGLAGIWLGIKANNYFSI